ncbi:carboxylate-amine ligase [Desulfolithobacter sp.]
MDSIPFAQSRLATLGLELEFQILDRKTLALIPGARQIFAAAPGDFASRLAPEFIQSMLEVLTGVCSDVDEVARDLRHTIRMLANVAEDQGMVLHAASLHPFAEPLDQVMTPDPRYERIMDELQFVGRQFITQGLHVHVGMNDREMAVRVCDVLQGYLPVFLALTGSSPWFRGLDTGLASYRTKLFEALPLAGLSSYFGSWQAYVDELQMLMEHGIIHQVRDLWSDVRINPFFGTVEVRSCDLPARFAEIVGMAGLIQAFAVAIVDGVVTPARINQRILAYNKWQAARYGLEGRFIDPLGLFACQTLTLRQAAEQLFAVLSPWMDRLGSRQWCRHLEGILERGTSASQQRELMQQEHSFEKMIQSMRAQFWDLH